MALPGWADLPSVLIGGAEQPTLNDRLISVLVEETTAGLYRCELTFRNWQPATDDYLFFDRSLIDFGADLSVKIGEDADAPVLFEGKVTGIEGRFPQNRPPEIAVLAEDALQPMRMTRRTRTFTDVTDADVIQTVAADYGFAGVSVSGPAAPIHAFVAQMNQSDLAFVRERARLIGAEIWVAKKQFHTSPRPDRDGGAVSLTYGETLLEFSVLADLAGQRSKVVVSGWDYTTKEAITATADSDAISAELGSLSGGGALLAGERVEQLVHTLPMTDAEATATAESTYRRLARRFVTGAGVTIGDARIKVGATVTLTAVGTPFDGAYYVTEVRHTFTDGSRYYTQFRVERPGIGG